MKQSFKNTQKSFSQGDGKYTYYSLPILAEMLDVELVGLPFSIRILLESCLRNHLEKGFSEDAIYALAKWSCRTDFEKTPVPFLPARILHQDLTGLPVLNDLTALRSAVKMSGKDPKIINPLLPTDLVVDHSIQVQAAGCKEAREINEKWEFDQNRERYEFLKWAEKEYDKFNRQRIQIKDQQKSDFDKAVKQIEGRKKQVEEK